MSMISAPTCYQRLCTLPYQPHPTEDGHPIWPALTHLHTTRRPPNTHLTQFIQPHAHTLIVQPYVSLHRQHSATSTHHRGKSQSYVRTLIVRPQPVHRQRHTGFGPSTSVLGSPLGPQLPTHCAAWSGALPLHLCCLATANPNTCQPHHSVATRTSGACVVHTLGSLPHELCRAILQHNAAPRPPVFAHGAIPGMIMVPTIAIQVMLYAHVKPALLFNHTEPMGQHDCLQLPST